MFYTLLAISFLISLLVAFVATRIFSAPADAILKRIIQDPIYTSWLKYLNFALYVVSISSGVRINSLEQYIKPIDSKHEGKILELTTERWTLEIYRTIIEALQGLAWVLLVFFLVALVAFVFVRMFEFLKERKTEKGA